MNNLVELVGSECWGPNNYKFIIQNLMENQIEADLSFYSCQNNSFIMQSQYNVMSSPRVSERSLSLRVSSENIIASDVLWPPCY